MVRILCECRGISHFCNLQYSIEIDAPIPLHLSSTMSNALISNSLSVVRSSGRSLLRRASISRTQSSYLRSNTSSSHLTSIPCIYRAQSTTTTSSSSIQPRQDALTSSDGVVGVPIDFDTSSSIEGKESQIVTIRLEKDQVLRAESGAMMYMTDGIQMNTTTGGGLSAGFKRMLTGQSVFISDYTYDGTAGPCGYVALGTDFPSKIVRIPLQEYGGKIICQQGAL